MGIESTQPSRSQRVYVVEQQTDIIRYYLCYVKVTLERQQKLNILFIA